MEFSTLESIQEENQLSQIFAQNSHFFDEWNFVGAIAKARRSRTEWYWSENGKKLDFVIRFKPGEPNNSKNNEMCLAVGGQTGTLHFNDFPCDAGTKFICQTKEFL